MSLLDSLSEPFTARGALALQARIDATTRSAIARARSVGRQRADAAEALWASGHAAEGLRLVIAALESTVEAAETTARALDPEVAPAAPEPEALTEAAVEETAPIEAEQVAPTPRTLAQSLRIVGIVPARASALETSVAAARSATLPELDAEISPAQAELYQRASDARRVIDRALGSAGMERREIQFARGARIAGTILAIVALLVVLRFALHTPEGVTAEVSGTWADAPAYGADAALDGRPDTFWLLPDRAEGWLDVRIAPGRRIERIRLLNTHNPPHHDRATRQYRVEIHSGGEIVRTIEGELAFSTAPEPVEHAVGIDDVDRIRFVVVSHHRTGAGLAELSFE
ncbi:hypothetical protein [Sandaracinus amylolyticus]|uniref:hypothetical protein n=1 Tax=Sandaracinus amylolyticus TaxID=927083 RepID=UPI001F1A419A|nr:hypothetical protein [Sandaracinus amylolyticus]